MTTEKRSYIFHFHNDAYCTAYVRLRLIIGPNITYNILTDLDKKVFTYILVQVIQVLGINMNSSQKSATSCSLAERKYPEATYHFYYLYLSLRIFNKKLDMVCSFRLCIQLGDTNIKFENHKKPYYLSILPAYNRVQFYLQIYKLPA